MHQKPEDDPGWLYGISGNFEQAGSPYHISKMKHRKRVREYRRLEKRVQEAGERARAEHDRIWENIITPNTEETTEPVKHKRTWFGWFYRLHAWMLSGNV